MTSPLSRLRRLPPGGERWWPGQARSTAFPNGLLRGHLEAGLLRSPFFLSYWYDD